MRIKHETYSSIFQVVYLGLATNALLLIGCAPLVIGLVVTDPTRSWPLLAIVAPLCTPAVVAAFAVLASGTRSSNLPGNIRAERASTGLLPGKLRDQAERASTGLLPGKLRDQGTGGVAREFWRVWRTSWRRATALGAMATAALVVLGVDVAWAVSAPGGRRIGAVMIPVLVMLMVLVVATGLLALVALAERPTARLRDLLRCSVYLAVRRWYLTAVSLLVLGLLAALFASRPALAIGLAASPLLYVVWANSRFSLRPALDT